MKRLALWLLLALLPISAASAQNVADPSGQQVVGAAQYRATLNNSVTVTTGNTFQLILAAAGPGTSNVRQSLTIQNNNSTDACYLIVGQATQVTSGSTTTSTNLTINGATVTAAQASIYLVGKGGWYTRYWPYVPSDPIYATCASTGDSLYVDIQ